MKIVGIVAVMLLCAAGGAPQEAKTGVIAGVVRTAAGDLVEGASVSALRLEAGGAVEVGTAATDDLGEYRIFGLQPGAYAVQVQLEQRMVRYPAEGAVRVLAGAEVGGSDVVLAGGEVAGSDDVGEGVSGVVQERGGAAISGAVVELVAGERMLRTRTDRVGEFRFARVRAGSYSVQVRCAGCLEGSRELKVEAGKPVEGLREEVERGGVIVGRVTVEGQAVVGARVMADRVVAGEDGQRLEAARTGTSDDRGEFRVYGLAPGRYILSVVVANETGKASGVPPRFFPEAPEFAEAVAVQVTSGRAPVVANMTLEKSQRWAVDGRVTVPEGARGLRVLLVPKDPVKALKFGPISIEVNETTGVFHSAAAWPGEYVVEAAAQVGGESVGSEVAVVVRGGAVHDVGVTLRPLLRVRGRVEAAAGCSLEGVEVEVRGNASRAHAGVMLNGEFTLEQVQPGSYRVTVRGLHGNCYAKRITLGTAVVEAGRVPLSAGDAVLGVVLSGEGGSLSGKAADAEGRALSGARVGLIRDEAGESDEARLVVADDEGRFLLEGLAPGEYRVMVLQAGEDFADSSRAMSTDVRIQAGDQQSVRLTGER